MLADGTTPIIWSLLGKLPQPLAMQKRPRWTGGLAIPMLPVMPWNDSDRPPMIAFGQIEYAPVASDTLPSNSSLCALALNSVSLKQFLQPQRPRTTQEWSRIPAVVRAQPPAVMTRFTFSGVSRDSAGAVLGNCQVLVFRTYDNILAAQTTSDGSGNWSVIVDRQQRHFFVEYKAGAPDVFGTSLNDRVPS